MKVDTPRLFSANSFGTRGALLLTLIALVASVYLCTSAGRAILDDGDALYAHAAQQMARSGDWVTPYANGVRFLDKPPMVYWLVASSYSVFGFTEFAARLPSALAVLGVAILMFFLGERGGGKLSGFAAGLAMAFCAGTFLFTMVVFPDILFVFFLTLSLYAFLRWYEDARNPLAWAMLFFASLAGAVLSKGMMGLVFPAAIVGIYLACAGEWRRLAHFHLWTGSLVFLVLALPWHVLAAVRNPGFLWYFFVNEQALRFIGKRQPLDYESISLPVFWGLVLLWLFPWSAFLPAVRHVTGSFSRQAVRARPLIWLCVAWVAFTVVFFSFSSRIEHYAMPVFPPLALLIGIALNGENAADPAAEAGRRRSVARGFAFLGILAAVPAALLAAAVIWTGSPFSGQISGGSSAGRFHAYKYYFAPLFEMPPEILGRLHAPLVGTCAGLVAGLLIAWHFGRKGRKVPAVTALSLMMAAVCLFIAQSVGICEEVLSSRQFGEKLNRIWRSGDRVVVMGDYETANSINFYLPCPLYVYDGEAALLQWGLGYPDAPGRMLSRMELENLWRGEQRTFLLAPDYRVDELGLAETHLVTRSGGRSLICSKRAQD